MAVTINPQVLLDSITSLSHSDKVRYSEIAFQEVFESADITKYHNVLTGFVCNTPIPFGSVPNRWDLMKSTAALTSNCDDAEACDVSMELSVKIGNPVGYGCTLEYCFSDIDCQLKDFMDSEKYLDTDGAGTQYQNFLVFMITKGIQNSHWTKTYFSFTSSTNTALNGHDGLFVQYLAAAPVNDAKRIEIPENAAATYDLQNALSATRGYEVFNELYERWENSAVDFRSRRDVIIKTTRALAYNYLKQLRTDKQLNCCERDTLTGIYNIDNLSIFGLKIEVVDEWDEILASPNLGFDDGTKIDNPHRAVLTYKDNEPILTGDSGTLQSFDVKYNDYTGKTKLSPKYTFDVKLLRDNHFLLAM